MKRIRFGMAVFLMRLVLIAAVGITPPNFEVLPDTFFDGVTYPCRHAAAAQASGLPTGNSAYTISVELQPYPSHNDHMIVVGWGSWSAFGHLHLAITKDKDIRHGWYASDDDAASSVLLDGSYHHVMITFNGTDRETLVDGVPISYKAGSRPASEFTASNTDNFCIGAICTGRCLAPTAATPTDITVDGCGTCEFGPGWWSRRRRRLRTCLPRRRLHLHHRCGHLPQVWVRHPTLRCCRILSSMA